MLLVCTNIAPEQPINLTVVAIWSNAVQLNWTAPAVSNGVIVSYTLIVNSTSTSITINTNSNITTYNVTDLTSCAKYTFAVSATTGCTGCTGPYSIALTNITTTANSVHHHYTC